MDLLIMPVPLFDQKMAVEAYLFLYREGNALLESGHVQHAFDGAMRSPVLDALNAVGVDAYTLGKPIFVPVGSLMMMTDLAAQCKSPPRQIVFVVGEGCKPREPFLSNMQRLRALGFRFALSGIRRLEEYAPVAALCDYILLDHRRREDPSWRHQIALCARSFRHLTIIATNIIATNIQTRAQFDALGHEGIRMFEGPFYRVPLSRNDHSISPLKLNLLKLMNLVRNENFELSAVAAIIQRDTALTVSLMRMINSPFLGLRQKVQSIDHAVTLLGQAETRKWVTTAVTKQLGADRPTELTRLSLVRARLADNLAPLFGLGEDRPSVFLMGLFSVLDVILELPMEEALQIVQVSDEIRQALLGQTGIYGELLRFLLAYEQARWEEVSRALIVWDLAPRDLFGAYMDALGWYGDLARGA